MPSEDLTSAEMIEISMKIKASRDNHFTIWQQLLALVNMRKLSLDNFCDIYTYVNELNAVDTVLLHLSADNFHQILLRHIEYETKNSKPFCDKPSFKNAMHKIILIGLQHINQRSAKNLFIKIVNFIKTAERGSTSTDKAKILLKIIENNLGDFPDYILFLLKTIRDKLTKLSAKEVEAALARFLTLYILKPLVVNNERHNGNFFYLSDELGLPEARRHFRKIISEFEKNSHQLLQTINDLQNSGKYFSSEAAFRDLCSLFPPALYKAAIEFTDTHIVDEIISNAKTIIKNINSSAQIKNSEEQPLRRAVSAKEFTKFSLKKKNF